MPNPKGHPETLIPEKAKWNNLPTVTIRVPQELKELILEIAHKIDEVGVTTSKNLELFTTREPETRKSGLLYRHYKGGYYVVVGFATSEDDNTQVVVYRKMDGGLCEEVFTRPIDEFYETTWSEELQRYVRRFKFLIDLNK